MAISVIRFYARAIIKHGLRIHVKRRAAAAADCSSLARFFVVVLHCNIFNIPV